MATLKQIIECAEQVVQGREEFVYNVSKHSRFSAGYSYSTKEGAPSCIVGQIMYRLDPELFRRVAEYEEYGDESFIIEDITLLNDPGLEDELSRFAGESVRFLAELQNAQDYGRSWGEALEIAKESRA